MFILICKEGGRGERERESGAERETERERETGAERERETDWERASESEFLFYAIQMLWRSFAFSCAWVDLTFQFEIVHWTGKCVQNQHLDIFSADLTFLDWIISRKLRNFERKLPYDTGKPFGPRSLNLFKSAQLQGAWLPAPSPRRRRSLRTPRVLRLSLANLVRFKALSILSGIWHRHAQFVWVCLLWSAEEKRGWNPDILPSTSGVPMVPLACSWPTAGLY